MGTCTEKCTQTKLQQLNGSLKLHSKDSILDFLNAYMVKEISSIKPLHMYTNQIPICTKFDRPRTNLRYSQRSIVRRTHDNFISTLLEKQTFARMSVCGSRNIWWKDQWRSGRMLKVDVMEEPNSAWVSPVVIALKQGKNRLCVDSRKLHPLTIKDAYPITNIEGVLSRLPKAQFIISVDLQDALLKIPLYPAPREKTAFTIPGKSLY